LEFETHGNAALAAVAFRPAVAVPTTSRLARVESDAGTSDLSDLVRRLEEVVRWLRMKDAAARAAEVLRFGVVEVEPATQTIRRRGERVSVTRTEFRLLYALLRRPGEILSREDLQQEVWGAEARRGSRAVDVHIARLRRKLESDPAAPTHILTAPYRGYRFDPNGT